MTLKSRKAFVLSATFIADLVDKLNVFIVCHPANMHVKCWSTCKYVWLDMVKFGTCDSCMHLVVLHRILVTTASSMQTGHFFSPLLWCELQSSETHVIRITSVLTNLDNSDAHELKNIHSAKNTHLTLVRASVCKRGTFLRFFLFFMSRRLFLWMRKGCEIFPLRLASFCSFCLESKQFVKFECFFSG